MNNTKFGFQFLDLSDVPFKNASTFKAGLYDEVKKALTGHEKNYIVAIPGGKTYIVSQGDVEVSSSYVTVKFPVEKDTKQLTFTVSNADNYTFKKVTGLTPADPIRPTAYGITVDIGTLNFDDGIIVDKEVTGIANVVNGATFAQHAQVGDTVNLVIKGIIDDSDTTEKDIMVVVPCAVTYKSTDGVEFDDCFIAPTGREVLVEAVNNDTSRVSYIVNFGYRVGKILRVGSDTKLQFTIQKMV